MLAIHKQRENISSKLISRGFEGPAIAFGVDEVVNVGERVINYILAVYKFLNEEPQLI